MSVTYKLLNKGNPGTATKVGSDDWDLVIKAFTGQASGIPAWIFRSTNKIGFADNVFWIESSANSKKINFRSSANTIDVNLFIPLLDDADNNLIIDTVANTLKERNIFEKDIDFKTTAQPATPGAGHVRLYLDTADSKLKFINSSGTIFDLTALGAADTKVIVQEAGSQVGSIARKLNFLTATDFNVTEDAPNDRINIEIADNAIGNSEIATHTSTKITINSSSQLPANVALEDTANNFLETITITKNAQAATAEVLLHMAVSDDAVGYARFYNTTTTNALIAPALDMKSGNSGSSCFILAQTTVPNDTGTTPVLIIDIRQDDNTPVTTRPLLTFRNSSGTSFLQFNANNQVEISPVWASNLVLANNVALKGTRNDAALRTLAWIDTSNMLSFGDSSGNGSACRIFGGTSTGYLEVAINTVTVLARAQAGVAESLATWKVSDDNVSVLGVYNETATDAYFSPKIQSQLNATIPNTLPALTLKTIIDGANDSGTVSMLVIKANNAVGGQITTKPLLDIQNLTTSVLKINAKGDTSQSIIAQAGVAEVVSKITISDDTGSTVQLVNNSAVDNYFAPAWRYEVSASVSNAIPACENVYYINSANDSGAVAIARFNARLHNFTAAVNRPLFDFMGNNVSTFKINSKGDQLQTVISQAGVAESLYKVTVNDADSNSFFQIYNYTTLDANFATKLVASTSLAPGSGPALGIWGWVTPGADVVSSTPVINIDARRTDATALVNRPILSISNLNTVVFRMNQNGDIVSTVQAQAGVGEVNHTWTTSDDTGSYLQVLNYTNVDGQYAPFIIGNVSTNVATNIPAFGLRANIPVVSDVGTVPLFLLESRLVGQDVAVRPLFQFKNRNTAVMTISAKGDVTHSIIAQTGVAEALATFQVSDSSGNLQILNGSSTDGEFYPWIRAKNLGTVAANNALLIDGQILAALDTGSTEIVRFAARTSAGGDITSRALFSFRNNANTVMLIGYKGDVIHTAIAQSGASEVLQKFTVSDDASSYLQINNGFSTDGVFIPLIVSHVAGASTASHAALYQYGEILAANDSGAVPVMIFNVNRHTASGAIVTRPLFEFRNNNVAVLTINPTNVDFKNTLIKNFYGQQEPSQRYLSAIIPPNLSTSCIGSNVFSTGFTFTGTVTSGNDASGGFTRMLCASSVDALANMIPNANHSVRGSNPKLQSYIVFDATTEIRFKHGLMSAQPAAGNTTIATNVAGVAFKYIAGTDTTVKVVTNDANGNPEQEIDTLQAITSGIYEIYFDGTHWNWAIYNTVGTLLVSGNCDANTQLPSTTHNIGMRTQMENITGAAGKSWYYRWLKLYKNGTGPTLPYN